MFFLLLSLLLIAMVTAFIIRAAWGFVLPTVCLLVLILWLLLGT